MKNRYRANKYIDRKIVKATTNKSKSINVKPILYRGGIRL